jgi:hypothetical protein
VEVRQAGDKFKVEPAGNPHITYQAVMQLVGRPSERGTSSSIATESGYKVFWEGGETLLNECNAALAVAPEPVL